MAGDVPARALDRRTFTKAAASLVIAPALAQSRDAPAPRDPQPATRLWPGYQSAIVIDALGSAGPFNVPDMFAAPLSDAMVENARRSGITAINVTLNAFGRSWQVFEATVRNIGYWENELDHHPDVFLKVKSAADLKRAKELGRVGLIFGFQDTTMLDTDVARVDLFHRLGVRIVQLTYNGRNAVGDGCLVPENAGLSPFGRTVVERMNARGVLIDLSHCGQRTTADAIAASRVPVAITHSGCAALNPVPRNKRDQELKAMAERGGVLGVYFMPFLRASGQPGADDLMRHIDHALKVCGEDHVGIGSDLSITPLELTPEFRRMHAGFVVERRRQGISAPGEAEDVFNYVPDFNSPRRLELVADRLASRGHTSARIEKIIGGNFARLFREVWGR